MIINDTRDKLIDAAFLEIYTNGYHGASISSILKNAGVPKGSLYHFFKSKKELSLAVINERISPKMDKFFNFQENIDCSIFETLENIFKKMSDHELLIIHGCPLHRIMVEMSSLDKDFDTLVISKFETFVNNLSSLLQKAIDKGELEGFNTHILARFFITSTWGEISLSPTIATKENFVNHTKQLLLLLKSYEKVK
ncbi:TetR/AcrR family transcriptional regulator [Campylobacterota bacterium DY0563]